MLTLSKDDAQRIGANLKRWSQRPIQATNARIMGLGGITVVMMLVAANHTPEPAMAVRGIAILFVALQGAVHYISVGALRVLCAAGIKEAHDSLAAYRDPRRISSLDMAMVWTAVALAAPCFA